MAANNVTPRVDLTAISPLSEIIIRGGDLSLPQAKGVLIQGYRQSTSHPDVYGLSVVFRLGASLDALAKTAHFPHRKLSYTILSRIISAMQGTGFEIALFITPSTRFVDHHTLAVIRSQDQQLQTSLPEKAADALLRAFDVVDNPYKQP